MNIDLTKEEAQTLLNLINIAVKAAGLEVAGPAVAMTDKLQQAFSQPAPDAEDPAEE